MPPEAETIEESQQESESAVEQKDDEPKAIPYARFQEVVSQRKRLEKELRELQQRIPDDFDPDHYRELVEAKEEAERRKAEEKGQWDSLRQQLAEKHQVELKKREQRETQLRSALESHLVDAEATRAIAKLEGSARLLLPHVKARVKVVEDDGRFEVRVLGDDGQPRLGAEGGHMSIEELVAEMKEDPEFGAAFRASGASGGGASSRSGNGGRPAKSVREMTDAEKMAFIDKHGLEGFKRLLVEAR